MPPTPMRSAAAMPRWPSSEGAKRVAVGRDGRTHSPELEAALVEGLTEGGLDVVRIGMGPSPMLYFAVATLDVHGGIQVTGSHNPADYNGFKMLLNGRSVFGAEIQDLGRRAAEGDWSEGEGKVERRRHHRRLCRRPGQGLRRQGLPDRLGRRQWRRRPDRSRSWSSGCPASITRFTPTSTAASPTTTPTPRSKPTSPT